jgi:hypothetical protein
MCSQARIAASRSNGRKSRGPRTAAGKSTARLNALRHGLYAATPLDVTPAPRVARLAKAICGDDPNPELLEQALIMAENRDLLDRVRAARIAAIERELAKIKKDNQKNDETDGGNERGAADPETREPTSAREMQELEAEMDACKAMLRAPLIRLERLERQV